jgi:hypothetical protein
MQLGFKLKDAFGGAPGWLSAVPANTLMDFETGRVQGPNGTLIRSSASRRWFPADTSVLAVLPPSEGPES